MKYIPAQRQTVGKPSTGILIDSKTGAEYRGTSVSDYQGNWYKGDIITEKSEPLIYSQQGSSNTEIDLTFYSRYMKPSPEDYNKGYYTRYFVKDNTTNMVKEVNQDVYRQELKLGKLYRKPYQLVWYLKPENIKKNLAAMEQAEKELPLIRFQVLKSADQFVH